MNSNVSHNSVNSSVNLTLTRPTREIPTLADTISLGLSDMTVIFQNTKATEIKISISKGPLHRSLESQCHDFHLPGFLFVDSLVSSPSVSTQTAACNPLTKLQRHGFCWPSRLRLHSYWRQGLGCFYLWSTRLLWCILEIWRVGRLVICLLC